MKENFRGRWRHLVFCGSVMVSYCLIYGTLLSQAFAQDPLQENAAYTTFAIFSGLSPADRALSADPDKDNVCNREEFLRGTDPLCADTDRDGFRDDVDFNPLSRAFIPWGDPWFTQTNDVTYTWPKWMIAAYCDGGEWVWSSVGHAWKAEDVPGSPSLHMEVDRELLTNNAVLKFSVSADSTASLFLDLYDSNEVIVASNVGANLLSDIGTNAVRSVVVPFEFFPEAVGLRLRCERGRVFIGDSLLYVDQNGDGYDSDQALQLGIPDIATSQKSALGDIGTPMQPMPSDITQLPVIKRKKTVAQGSISSESQVRSTGARIIYVDKSLGNDTWSGAIPSVQTNDGPKKSISAGRAHLQKSDTLVIRTGSYKEDLDISGLDVEVRIEGDVKL